MAFYKCARIYVTENSNTEINTASGPIANFNTLLATPLLSLKANFKATQEAGTPTPQSPKAISGVSAVNVVHCGKNLFQYDENRIAQAETSTQATRAYYNLGFKNCTIAFSGSFKSGVTPDNTRLNIGKLNNGILTVINDFIKDGGVNDRVITFGADDTAVIMYTAESTIGFKTAIEKFDLQLEISSQSSSFEPYNGSTTLINLNGTYYGGYVSQDKDGKRELVVTHTIGSLAIGDALWREDTNRVGIFFGALPQSYGRKERSDIYACSCFNATNPYATMLEDLYISGKSSYGGTAIFFRNSAWTGKTSAEINTLLANETFVYERAEPFTVALPDGECIKSFAGINNIYADTGDTTVEYRNLTQGG